MNFADIAANAPPLAPMVESSLLLESSICIHTQMSEKGQDILQLSRRMGLTLDP